MSFIRHIQAFMGLIKVLYEPFQALMGLVRPLKALSGANKALKGS